MANTPSKGELLQDAWNGIWNRVKGRPSEVRRSIRIPNHHVVESGPIPASFRPKQQYFAVVINEMFLSTSRKWWSEFDPMALVVTEFSYGGKPKTIVPYVVGPSLIQAKLREIPNSMSITDTVVAGIHPYTGGKLTLTVILAQVKRESHAQKLLDIVENVAQTFKVGVALEPHLKVGNAVLKGVEALFGLEDTKPIVGHRWEYDDGITPSLSPGFFALIDADENEIRSDDLRVDKGRLLKETGGGQPSSYRDSDFLLYSLRAIDERNDIDQLPFYSLFTKAMQSAAKVDPRSWDEARAQLMTLYQEMLLSPDLTFDQVMSQMKLFKSQLKTVNEGAKDFVLGPDRILPSGRDAGSADPDDKARVTALNELHSILDL